MCMPMATAELRLTFLLAALLLSIATSTTSAQSSPSFTAPFVPSDNFLIDCGATAPIQMPDNHRFKTDPQSSPFLSSTDHNLVSIPSTASIPSPLYLSARLFIDAATYVFQLSRPGWHCIGWRRAENFFF